MTILLEKRDWHISPQMYSELMRLYALYARYDDMSRFDAEVMSRFGLRPYTEYRIIVDWGHTA